MMMRLNLFNSFGAIANYDKSIFISINIKFRYSNLLTIRNTYGFLRLSFNRNCEPFNINRNTNRIITDFIRSISTNTISKSINAVSNTYMIIIYSWNKFFCNSFIYNNINSAKFFNSSSLTTGMSNIIYLIMSIIRSRL